MCVIVAIADGVIEEEEFGGQYREPEVGGEYREQELPEGFGDGKSNLLLWCIFIPVLQTQPIGLFYKIALLYCWNLLNSHSLIVMTIPWWPRFTSKYDMLYLDVNHC